MWARGVFLEDPEANNRAVARVAVYQSLIDMTYEDYLEVMKND